MWSFPNKESRIEPRVLIPSSLRRIRKKDKERKEEVIRSNTMINEFFPKIKVEKKNPFTEFVERRQEERRRRSVEAFSFPPGGSDFFTEDADGRNVKSEGEEEEKEDKKTESVNHKRIRTPFAFEKVSKNRIEVPEASKSPQKSAEKGSATGIAENEDDDNWDDLNKRLGELESNVEEVQRMILSIFKKLSQFRSRFESIRIKQK